MRRSFRLGSLIALFLASCCPPPAPLPAQWKLPNAMPSGTVPLGRRVVLVADNQANHLYGAPTFLRTEVVDHIVSVAVRPVQTDLFGQDLLEWILDVRGDSVPVVHLGDAMNIACRQEWDRFAGIMRAAQRGWVLAPGNHDAFFMGNAHVDGSVANLGLSRGDWGAACDGADHAMDKAAFVRTYLGALVDQGASAGLDERPGLRALAIHLQGGDLPACGDEGAWNYEGTAHPFLEAAAWRIDCERPWRSFVVQRINLGSSNADERVVGVVLDTSQYRSAPTIVSLSNNAGLVGGVLDDQARQVERWLAVEGGDGVEVVFFGHHPYGSLDGRSRETVEGLMGLARRRLYVSAHTHAGHYTSNASDGIAWPELNVGSVVDWPPEYRDLRMSQSQDGATITMRTRLYRLADETLPPQHELPTCLAAWEPKPEDPDYFFRYLDDVGLDPAATHRKLLDTILMAYARLVEHALALDAATIAEHRDRLEHATQDPSTGARLAAIADVERFERERVAALTADELRVHRDYRLCQALWSSTYDKSGSRIPAAGDQFLSFPKEM